MEGRKDSVEFAKQAASLKREGFELALESSPIWDRKARKSE